MKKLIVTILNLNLLFFTMANCKTGSQIKVEVGSGQFSINKKEGFNESTRRVSTLQIYNKSTKKLGDVSDSISNIIGITIDSKISQIYGESIVGGQAINDLANKLKLKDFDKAVQNLVASQLDNSALTNETKKTFSTIIEKGKIDALAIPVISTNSDKIFQGEKIQIHIIVFDGKTSNIQYLASSDLFSAKPDDITLYSSKPDQAKANSTALMIENTNKFMQNIQIAIKPNSVLNAVADNQKESVKDVVGQNNETPKEKEFLEPLDNWLKSKIKIGLGPIVIGIVGILALIL